VENLSFYAGVYGINDKGRILETLAHVGLTDQIHELASGLSTAGGSVCAGDCHRAQPRLLFLDEPTSGVDPNARRIFWDLLYDLQPRA